MTIQIVASIAVVGIMLVGMSAPAMAFDDETVDAAIGGGLGGAVGAAGGAAVTTDGDDHYPRRDPDRYYDHADYGRRHGGFCPPGQAKKGRC